MTQTSDSQLPDYLSDLNPPQLEAVSHLNGPILILAGAGSGKTRVLTRRVAHLVLAHRVRPQNILAVTFTNKATDEMRARLRGLLGERADQLWVATFHAAALRILRRHANQLGYDNDFAVYDEQDSRGVLKEVLKQLNIDDKKNPIASFARFIDAAKNAFVMPEQVSDWSGGKKTGSAAYFHNLAQEVYQAYQAHLMRSNAMDFGDLLVNVVLLLQRKAEILSYYQNQLRFVLVDEFQDTNQVQYLLVKLLTAQHHNLLVVGDDDQSIYAFRGATIRNILEFEKDFPETKIVFLEQNYRSTANILDAAHAVIKRNVGRRKKKLWTEGPAGDLIGTFVGSDETEEAEFVAQQIKSYLQEGGRLQQIAIFYRTNAQSRVLEEVLVNHSIPYRIYGGLKFYERKEVKDILAYLRLAVNEADDQAFLRIVNTPPRGIGAQSVQTIVRKATEDNCSLLQAAGKLAGKNKGLTQFVDLMQRLQNGARELYLSSLIVQAIQESDYGPRLQATQDPIAQSRLENLRELEAIGRSMEEAGQEHFATLTAFLDRVALTAGDERPEDKAANVSGKDKPEAVALMTLHLAKGLEFPLVFMTGMEEGLLPHYRSLYDEAEIEEERRLCYVGITRAMRRLFLSRAYTRGMFSSGDGFGLSGGYRETSRFIYDIPEELLEQSPKAMHESVEDLLG